MIIVSVPGAVAFVGVLADIAAVVVIHDRYNYLLCICNFRYAFGILSCYCR